MLPIDCESGASDVAPHHGLRAEGMPGCACHAPSQRLIWRFLAHVHDAFGNGRSGDPCLQLVYNICFPRVLVVLTLRALQKSAIGKRPRTCFAKSDDRTHCKVKQKTDPEMCALGHQHISPERRSAQILWPATRFCKTPRKSEHAQNKKDRPPTGIAAAQWVAAAHEAATPRPPRR